MAKPDSQRLKVPPFYLEFEKSLQASAFIAAPLADERGMTAGKISGQSLKERGGMDGRITLGNALAGFAVGLFVHAIPASWWPRWLRELVGKDE
jgi:fructose-specific phosphotransferase system IIC component